ncbi:DUF3891 family protein [Geitlerinema sp. PCC 7407]|uniref:DUF3891 family protein n=1 Tax=Geitlerinema sp. PCC 7407 TaxID=1173025 RepID=UPI00029FDB0A|nr:DUF3891 family protein [Geitlerinema sp. PCC 7407]AFY67455.1 hypothetical protein GEI7407_2985 [Geitlerinema sp. PCC 7407]
MIVNLLEDGWEVIYHRAHALLAAQIAGHWCRQNAPTRFYETIAAISHHDDLEREFEEHQLTAAGAPLDFTLDGESSIDELRTHIQNARYRGRWVTLLISRHLCFLHQARAGTSPDWDAFLEEQRQQQAQWRSALGVSEEAAEEAYQFMRWCDRLSLILAQRRIPASQRALEITRDLQGQRYDLRQMGDRLTVEPWPFEEPAFTVDVEATYLPQLHFEDNAALIAALQEAPIRVLEWHFAKA